jgi:hypothetical protein
MTLLLLWLRRLPTIAYVVAFVCVALLAAGWGIYRTGYSHGEVTVKREALQDSVDHAVQRLDTAVQQTERARKLAQTVKRWSDSSKVRRDTLRANVESLLSSLPEPVVTLIRADDNQIRRDSVTITAFAAVDSSWVHERSARIDADSLEARLARIGQPVKHHRTLYILGAGAAFVAGVLIAGAVR